MPAEVGPPRINRRDGEQSINSLHKIRVGYIDCSDRLCRHMLEVDPEVELGREFLEIGEGVDVIALLGIAQILAISRSLRQFSLDPENSRCFCLGSLHRIAGKHEQAY